MIVWNQGMELAVKGYEITKLLPKEELFGLKSQINRALVSIPSNIAEGCSRSSEKDFARFLEISLGSTFEVETQLLIAEQISYLSSHLLKEFLTTLRKQQKQTFTLINKIRP
jgi:four helix bundle protein